MTRPKVTKLNEKHWLALKLIEEGETNMAEVSRQIGMDNRDFHRLLRGNVEKAGNIATVFQLEYSKLLDRIIAEGDKKIGRLLNKVTDISLEVIHREIKKYQDKNVLNHDDQKMLTYLTKAAASLRPSSPKSVNLTQTWNYTKGLTPQELEHEFGRLKGLSEGPPDTRGVSKTKQG